MRLLQIMAVGLFAGLAAAGQAQDEARAILEKAIKARGGEADLTKYKAGTIKAKGRIEILDGVDFSQEITYLLPGKFRDEMSMEIKGNQIRTVTVFDGTKGVLEVNGKKVDLGDKLTDPLKDAAAMLEAHRLVPLRDKAYELAPAGEVEVNGKPALGIRVTKKGQRDFTLFFDKGSHLLVKVEGRTVDVASGQEVTQERIITEYHKVDGRPQVKRILMNRDGKKFMEAEVTEAKEFEKVDEGQFKLP